MGRSVWILIIFLLVLPGSVIASDRPLNEVPMYGESEPTRLQMQAHEGLFAAVKRAGVSRQVASNQAVDRGWQALSKGDAATAIRRFNQGWILDPENGRTYWGFAVILHVRDKDLDGSVEMFERAHELLPQDPSLLVDFGRILETSGRPREAIAKFEAALAMNETIPPAYFGLVRAYLAVGDTKRALDYALKGRKFGTKFSDREIEELKQLDQKNRQ